LNALSFSSYIFKKKSLRSKLVFDKLVEVASKLELSEEEQEEIIGYLKLLKSKID
jgi:hypothetical protein